MLQKLKVVNGRLTDGTKPARLFGMSTHGIAWHPQYVCEETFRALRDEWGANCVRIAMYTDEFRGYCNGGDKERLKSLVEKGVELAEKLDMYVLVDWHVLREQDPMVYVEEAEAFFDDVSKRFANKANVLYEICNEPNGCGSWDRITEYAKRIIPVIRRNSPDAVVIVGTPTWSQEVQCAVEKPLAFDNVMYSLHFYAATHKRALRNRVERCLQAGLPIFVSEFGLCEASGKGEIDHEEAAAWHEIISKAGLSCLCWCLSNGGDTCSVFAKNCTKLSGWEEADLKESGRIARDWFRGFANEEKADE